jgi:hypothetical protein
MQSKIHRFFVDDGFRKNCDLIKGAIILGNHQCLSEMLSQLSSEEINSINSTKDLFEDYLLLPVKRGYLKIIKVLHEHKININAVVKVNILGIEDQINALHIATTKDLDINIIQYLIEQGVDVNLCSNGWYNTPLMELLNQPKYSPIKCPILLMLEAGAELDQNAFENYGSFIKKLIGKDKKVEFINVGTAEKPVYRMLDANGVAYKTHHEKFNMPTNSNSNLSFFSSPAVTEQNGGSSEELTSFMEIDEESAKETVEEEIVESKEEMESDVFRKQCF